MIRELLRRNQDFWTHERSLTALLIYLSLSLLLWLPLSGYQWWEFAIRDVLFNLILLSGVFSVLTHWKRQLIFIGIAVLAFFLRFIAFAANHVYLEALNNVITVAFFLFLGWLVLRHIIKDGPVNHYRIQGSIVIFMIVGIVMGYLYHLIELLHPGAFIISRDAGIESLAFSDFLYFSFVTMTTLGYGDVLPHVPLAKSLVIFQSMFGLLYPVIMVARLVAMEIDHSRGRR